MTPWRMVRLLLWAGLKSRLEYRVDFVMFVLQAAFGNLLSFFFVWASSGFQTAPVAAAPAASLINFLRRIRRLDGLEG